MQSLKIGSSINLPWGHARSHIRFGPDQLNRFDFTGYKQTKTQTDKDQHRRYIIKINIITVCDFKLFLQTCQFVILGENIGQKRTKNYIQKHLLKV